MMTNLTKEENFIYQQTKFQLKRISRSIYFSKYQSCRKNLGHLRLLDSLYVEIQII